MARPVQILPATMTSLPMPTSWPAPVGGGVPSGPAYQILADPGSPGLDPGDEQSLLHAFRSFAEAAGSLEHSYGLLRAEVARLHHELESSNSDLARSLEENRSMRAHLDRILEGLPCGVLVASGAGEVSRANPEALRLLAIDKTSRLASISSLPAALQELLDLARREGGEKEIEMRGELATSRWLAVRHASIADANSDSSSVFILRDVSGRKRLEEAQEKLSREQALAEMSAVLAHEIRNPLGSLELFAGLLAESDLDSECRKWVEHIQAGLRTLAATVNNVLHFHSLPEPERAPVDLGQLLDWARDFFVPLARQSHITLSFQNHVQKVFLAADRHRLEQVVLNLVLNAVRAMPGGGWIEISGRKVEDGRAVALGVADTGPGITPEHLPNIFEPGFSTRSGSPGLGLAVCRKIVEQHGGTIAAVSRPGCGAKFTITFPLLYTTFEGVSR